MQGVGERRGKGEMHVLILKIEKKFYDKHFLK